MGTKISSTLSKKGSYEALKKKMYIYSACPSIETDPRPIWKREPNQTYLGNTGLLVETSFSRASLVK